MLPPTADPSQNIQKQTAPYLAENEAIKPKHAVRKSVALNGNDRPRTSESDPHAMAPTNMPDMVDAERALAAVLLSEKWR